MQTFLIAATFLLGIPVLFLIISLFIDYLKDHRNDEDD